MKNKISYLFLFFLLITVSGCSSNGCRQNALPSPAVITSYQPVKDWPQLPEGYSLGNPTGIGIDTGQHLFIFRRAGRKWPLLMPMPRSFISAKTILMLDRQTGKILNSWGAGLFIMPHGLTVDHHNNIWVTDVGLHQVFKFSHDGVLLMKLGVEKLRAMILRILIHPQILPLPGMVLFM